VPLGTLLGTLLGTHLGWRATFGAVALLAAFAAVALAIGLPKSLGAGWVGGSFEVLALLLAVVIERRRAAAASVVQGRCAAQGATFMDSRQYLRPRTFKATKLSNLENCK